MVGSFRHFLISTARPACCAALLLLAGSCGSSSSSSNDEADITVAIADAPLDDVTSFSLAVTAISLTSSTGAVQPLLGAPIVVDLATLTNVSQLVGLGSIDPGQYNSASITVDFTNASCFLVNQTTPAALVDDQGAALTGVVTMTLDISANPFTAVTGQNHVMELDFDFNQMLTVLPANTVEVVPTVKVRFDRPDQHALVAYGEGQSINLSEINGVMTLESLDKTKLRNIALNFDVNCVYHVNGVAYVGATGLSNLGSNKIGTWFQAYGVAHPSIPTLLVTYVEAGAGTVQGGQDFVDGYVIDRDDSIAGQPAFTVMGSSSDAAHTTFHQNTVFSVLTTQGVTHVIERLSSLTTFTTDAINVGQHIQAYGTLSALSLDATTSSGIVRALATPYSGTPVAAPVGTVLTMNLARVGPLDQTLFIWADSGTTTPDPTNFAIDIGTLGNGLTIDATTPQIVTGFMMPVTNAGPTVATATALQDVTSKPVVFQLRDRPAGFTVVTATTGGLIDFTITGTQGADETAALDSGFQGVVALPTSPDPTIVAGTAPATFVIFHPVTHTTTSYALFSDFVNALGVALSGTETLRQFAATGSHDATTNAFAADSATAVLQ